MSRDTEHTGYQGPARLTSEWIEEVKATGKWFEPNYWSVDAASSPYEADEVEAAFAWLQSVYTPRVARRIFQNEEQPLLSLLASPWALPLSELASLGVDGVLAEPPARLVSRLRHAGQYFGARNELEVMAALIVAGCAFEFEPLRGGEGSNPDFFLPEPGDGLFLDVKRGGKGRHNEEAEELANRITGMNDFRIIRLGRYTTVSFTNEMRSLLGTPAGVRSLRPRVDELSGSVRQFILSAHEADKPSSTVIDGLVRVEVGEKVESGELGGYDIRRPDPLIEANRIVTTYLADGASQLPEGRPGAVIIDVDNSPEPSESVDAIIRWLEHPSEEGALYPQVLGAILVYGNWTDDMLVRWLHVTPVWRRGTPQVYRHWRFWARFEIGLNWQRIRKWEWLRIRRESGL